MNGMFHVNKKSMFIFLSMILILVSIAFADDGNFYIDGIGGDLNESAEITSCGSINDTVINENIPYYVGLNEYGKLEVAGVNDGTYLNDSVVLFQVTFNESTWYNMSFDNTTNEWFAYLSSSIEEDQTALVRMTSSLYNCINESYLIKFREPYFLTVKLYDSNTTVSNPQPYVNDFNYVYLESHNSTTYMSVPSTNDVSNLMNNFYSFVPGIETLYPSTVDTTLVHWGKYTDGYAVIKLYDLGEYDLYLMSHSISGLNWNYEFFKPQQAEIKVDSRVEKQINITTKGNFTASVYISKFESDKMGYMMNIGYIIVVIIILLMGLGMLMYLPGMSKIVAPVAVALVLFAVKYIFNVI